MATAKVVADHSLGPDHEAKIRAQNKNWKVGESGVRSHSSGGQFGGRSIRWPSRSNENSSSTGIPGYGEPPRVKISHSRIPNDHLGAGPGLSRAWFHSLLLGLGWGILQA